MFGTHLEALHAYKDNEVVESQTLQKFNAWTKKKAMAKKQQQRIFRRGGNPYAATLVTAKGRSATSGSVGRAASSSAASSSTILPRLVVRLVDTKLSPDDCCGRGVVIKPRSVRGIASSNIIVVPSLHWLVSESAEKNAWDAILVVGLGKWIIAESDFNPRASAEELQRTRKGHIFKATARSSKNHIYFGKRVLNHSTLVSAFKACSADELENSKRIVHLRVDAFRLVSRRAGTTVMDVKAFKDSKLHLLCLKF